MPNQARISLYGGPGCGKSTVAALLFGIMKMRGHSVELVNEYIKSWVYEKREPQSFDQLYIFAKQQRLEDRVLRAGVEYVISDSPLLLQCYYAKKNNFVGWEELLALSKKFDAQTPSVNYFLRRHTSSYEVAGRWQTEEQARIIDDEILQFFKDYNIPHIQVNGNAEYIANLFEKENETTI